MTAHRYMTINSFGNKVFTGNPVAVFFNCDNLSNQKMQSIAAELNLSETTFIRAPRQGGDFFVKIFTPVNELPFAGHPLLGTALAIAKENQLTNINIETLKGIYQFSVRIEREHPVAGYIEMEQPTPEVSVYDRQEELLQALGVNRSILPVEMYKVGPRHVFVAVDNTKILSNINPDLKQLAKHENMAALCFCADKDTWRLRMFSPAYGVAEDAATGSAAGPLALHLCRHGVINYHQKIKIIQGVEMGRISRMYATASLDDGIPQLTASGHAFQVSESNYFIQE